MSPEQETYPLSIRGELTEPLNNALWLVKWLLIIPHLIVLAFLWVAFCVVWVIALFTILFTGKYPRELFDFSVGVLRWTWRVGFYSYQALGTDKYPPFTLDSVDDYPADLQVEYPESLSQGLVLVKWWLLAIPHWIVVSMMQGGWDWAGWTQSGGEGPGLVVVLVIIAAVALLFTGKYHQDIFKLVMGMNRWAYRVAAYVSLMTDKYPPFRLWDD